MKKSLATVKPTAAHTLTEDDLSAVTGGSDTAVGQAAQQVSGGFTGQPPQTTTAPAGSPVGSFFYVPA